MRKFGSFLWAVLILAAITGWVLSGKDTLRQLAGKNTQKAAPASTAAKPALTRVKVRLVQARPRTQTLIVRGRTEAVARVQVRARTSGQVIALPARKGAFVKAGTPLCILDQGARPARLAEARAALAQAKLDYEASATLMRSGFTPKTQKAAQKARLDAAKAAIASVKLDIERTSIKAPFDGIIEDQPAKTGDLLQPGEICAVFMQPDPLLIIGDVSERDIGALKRGMKARAELVTGELASGHLRFISPSARIATRTFRIELEVANGDRRLRDGVTAQIQIPLTPVPAHLLASSLLSLNDAGELGVRVVDEENIVRFIPTKILADSEKGVWVSGLPDQIRLITAGQDYVRSGQKVEPVPSVAETRS